MSYARPFGSPGLPCFGGLGAIPIAVSTRAGQVAAAKVGASGPEAEIAVGMFAAAMSGNGPAYEAATKAAISSVATIGAAAACAATGAGAALAPVCGFVGGTVSKVVTGLLFPDEETCGAALRRVRDGAYGALVSKCVGDRQAEAELLAAAQRYAERTFGSCALTDNWSMAGTIRAEATKMGLSLGKGENGVFGFASQDWKAYINNRFASEAGAAILGAKTRKWARDAAQAKAVADAEYDALSKSCPPRGISIGTLSPCQQKAADVAVTIAARQYVYATIEGAPAIAQGEIEALRRQFLAEIAQDKAIAASTSALAKQQAEKEAAARLALSNRIKGAATATDTRTMIGLGLGVAAVTGLAFLAVKSGALGSKR